MLFLGQIEWRRKNEALSKLRKLQNERKVLDEKIKIAKEEYESAKKDHDKVFGHNLNVDFDNASLFGSYYERYK